LEEHARIKGVDLLGCGDFTHPKWNADIKQQLKEDDKGILWSNTGYPFLWQTEISLMYSQGGKGRRVHNLIFSPNGEVSHQIIEALGKKGRLDYDGRPIFGFSCIELIEMMRSISDKIEIIPAHCLTPWFGLFGSKSGFDSIKECFQEKTKFVHAVETGMSADPPMMWRLKEDINVVSFSDAHSYHTDKLGRECTIFDMKELSYESFLKSVRTGDGLDSTIETYPEYGKYHYDGHRLCGVSLSPKESLKLKGICPKCKKPLTIGVEYRIEELAKEPIGYKPEGAKPFIRILPLLEVIAIVLGKGLKTKTVSEVYNKFVKGRTEFDVLLRLGRDELIKLCDNEKLVDVILTSREGNLKLKPGYDGVYGKIIYNNEVSVEEPATVVENEQKSLSEY